MVTEFSGGEVRGSPSEQPHLTLVRVGAIHTNTGNLNGVARRWGPWLESWSLWRGSVKPAPRSYETL